MRLIKLIRLIGTFYQGFLLFSILMTTCCMIPLWKFGIRVFAVIFWLKLMTLGLTVFFINDYKRKEFVYYQNLGISKIVLWTVTLLFDFTLFLFLLNLVYNYR